MNRSFHTTAITRSGGGTLWPWALAGLTGGALVGAADALLTVVRGVGGLGIERAARLLVLDAGLLGVVGLLLGALFGVAAAALDGAARRRAAVPELAATVVAAPVLIVDARLMFTGHKAASLPGHALLSVAVAAGGLASVFLFARGYRRRLALASTAAASPRRARAAWLALLLAAAAAHAANGLLLVRLYPWFHATLALATLVLAMLAARLRLASPAARASRADPGPGRPPRPALALALGALAVLVACAVSFPALRRSQVLRFAVYERTALAAVVMNRVPFNFGPRMGSRAAVASSADLPPLPDGPHRPDASVLVITVDALRADHIGAYGYRRRTTPSIDALAARATRFSHAYAQAPHTSFSIASLLTGKYFATLARLAPEQVHASVASVMRMYGWRTAAFYPPAVFYIDAEKLRAYADNNFGFEYVKFEYLDAQRRVDQLVRYYEDVKPEKSFVWVHFFEPHEPYQIHAGFDLGGGDVDRYDSEIAYVDAAIGRLLAYLQAHRPNTIVVLGADHGEEFDEHGGRYHGTTLYEEQLHIPLLIAVPGVAPAVIDGPVQLLDVTPTVLNVLNIPVPVRMRGTDLGPWLARPPADSLRLPPAFAEVDDHRLVAQGDERLICDLSRAICAYYDLAADPGERKNLADERPARADALRAVLDGWLDEQVHLEPLPAPPAGGEPSPRPIERGRLGDARVAGDLAALLASNAPVEQRREAARLLAALPPHPDTAPALAAAAAGQDPIIAVWAQVSRARQGDPAARAVARAQIADQAAEPRLRVRSALALAAIHDGSGLDLLGQTLEPCADAALCREIVAALATLGDTRAVPYLLRALPQVQNRRETVAALGQLGDRRARAALIDRLESDEYVPVRIEAARALVRLGDAALVPALERAAAHELEPEVADAARAAARALHDAAVKTAPAPHRRRR